MSQDLLFPIPPKAGFISRGTCGGEVTTSEAFHEIPIVDEDGNAAIANSLSIVNRGAANLTIRLSNEAVHHVLRPNEEFAIDRAQITQVTVSETGAVLTYSGQLQ